MSEPSAANEDPSSTRSAWWALAIVLVVSVAYESRFIHYGINRLDESWQLYSAMRMHSGGVLYDDVLWVFPPGHVWAAWLAWWWHPPGFVTTRLIYAGFDVALAGLVYVLARRLMSQPFAILAGLLVALAAPRGHVYQLLFGYRYLAISMLALLALDQRLRGRGARWIWISGALTGAALVFRLTPAFSVSCGIAAGLLATHRDWKKWLPDGLRFSAGLFLVTAPVLAYFATTVGLARMLQEVVVHPLAMLQPLPLPDMDIPAKWGRRQTAEFFVAVQFRAIWVFYSGYAVVLAVSWLRHFLRKERYPHGLLLAIVVFGGVFFTRSTGRSDEPHLDSVIPPVCLLVAHFLSVVFDKGWPQTGPTLRTLGASAVVAGTVASWIYLLATDGVAFPDSKGMRPLRNVDEHIVVRPIEKARDIDRTTYLLRTVTKPGELILNLSATPVFHALSGRQGPGYFDIMMLGTFLEDEDEIWFLEHLKKNPPAAVVWPGRKFDNMESRSIQHVAPRVTAWVRANYAPLPKQHRWFVMVPRPHLARP
ncbi:MAG: hypothetical protein AAEJ52_21180 [Myxococcota bacterium]